MLRSRLVLSGFLCFFLLSTAGARAEQPFRYTEGKHGKGELKYRNNLPVLSVEGTPEEIGAQVAALTAKDTKRLLTFPKEYLKAFGYEAAWPALVKVSNSMVPQFPADHLKELDAFVKRANIDRELVIVGNTFTDIKKIGGCSTLIVEPARSATGGPLFGRNLDYPTLGFLHEYTLVTVYRPAGTPRVTHALASIGFPGMFGCISGINDAGLALAVLEVYSASDGSARFDPQGVPYALCFRRLLEECSTVAEAEKLLRSMKRTTRVSLAVCDQKGGSVFEITPKSVVVRPPEAGICPCTNHFRTRELAAGTQCRRYRTLEKSRDQEKIDLLDLAKLLDSVNQGDKTFQTMIFEPAALKLHLAIGKCPSSALEPKLLELAPLFKKTNHRGTEDPEKKEE